MTGVVAASETVTATPVFDDSADMFVRLWLPYAAPPDALRGNARNKYWGPRNAATRMVRNDVLNLGRQAKLHRLDLTVRRVSVVLQWAPGDNRRRDADNLFPFYKAICDGIARGPRRDWTGLDLVPDDTPQYFVKHTPVIVPPPAKGMWVDISLWFNLEDAS